MEVQSAHDREVAQICAQVKQFHAAKKHFRIYHGSTSSTRPMSFQQGSIINTSGLTRVFPIDKTKRTVKVEPKVPMDELARATLKEGLIPKVVMELMGITVGGGYSGTSGESSSFKYGLFEHTIAEIEIILGDGTLTTASRTHQPDLLEWAGSAMGTFGVVTLLEVELIEAKPYIKLDLQPIKSAAEAVTLMEPACCDPAIDFIDSILFNKNLGMVMTGSFTSTSTPPDPSDRTMKSQSFSARSDPWFTNYLESVVSNKKSTVRSIIVPTLDYLFRYDRGCFWGGKLAFQYFHLPFNRFTRWALDPLMSSRVSYQALHEGGFASRFVVQDFGIPKAKVAEFVEHISTILPDFQFFLCPTQTGSQIWVLNRFRTPPGKPEARQMMSEERTYGVGVYGPGPKDPDKFLAINRELEQVVWNRFYGGKLLYARSYYTEEEFWAIYNKEAYHGMRAKYNAQGLPDVYQKIAQDMGSGRRPRFGYGRLSGYYAAAKTAKGMLLGGTRKEYLLRKEKKAKRKEEAKEDKQESNGATGVNGVNGH